MTAIGLLLWNCTLIKISNIDIFGYEIKQFALGTYAIGSVMIWAAVILTVYSFIGYVKQMTSVLRD